LTFHSTKISKLLSRWGSTTASRSSTTFSLTNSFVRVLAVIFSSLANHLISPFFATALGLTLEKTLPDFFSKHQVTNKAINRFLTGVWNKRRLRGKTLTKTMSFEKKVFESRIINAGFQEEQEKLEDEKRPLIDAESLVFVDILQHCDRLLYRPRSAEELIPRLVQHIKSKDSEARVRKGPFIFSRPAFFSFFFSSSFFFFFSSPAASSVSSYSTPSMTC